MIRSWSLSALNLYEQCPLKYKRLKIDKLPTKPSWALENGIAIHNQMENYLNDEIQGVPKPLKKLETELKNLKEYNAYAEEQYVLNTHWEPVEGEKAWFSSSAWLRAKVDARVDNLVVDLKTGRHYDKYSDQAELYGIAVLKSFEEFDTVDVEFWYNRTGDIKSYEVFRSDLDDMVDGWNERVASLFREKHWLPKENEWCKYCEFQDSCPMFE